MIFIRWTTIFNVVLGIILIAHMLTHVPNVIVCPGKTTPMETGRGWVCVYFTEPR